MSDAGLGRPARPGAWKVFNVMLGLTGVGVNLAVALAFLAIGLVRAVDGRQMALDLRLTWYDGLIFCSVLALCSWGMIAVAARLLHWRPAIWWSAATQSAAIGLLALTTDGLVATPAVAMPWVIAALWDWRRRAIVKSGIK